MAGIRSGDSVPVSTGFGFSLAGRGRGTLSVMSICARGRTRSTSCRDEPRGSDIAENVTKNRSIVRASAKKRDDASVILSEFAEKFTKIASSFSVVASKVSENADKALKIDGSVSEFADVFIVYGSSLSDLA
jgi:hypothetical protein